MTFLKSLLDKLTLALLRFPPLRRCVNYASYRSKRLRRREIEKTLRYEGKYGDHVIAGPFIGMQFPPPDRWISDRFQKTIGCYEKEIFPWLDRVIQKSCQYTDIVNPGAADGMFIIGLGRLFTKAKLWAFEPRDQPSSILAETATLNGVIDRLKISGFCDPTSLSELEVGSTPLVFCDVEGYENVLLDPQKVPWLKTADIIVELHELFEPGVSGVLRKRFQDTHTINSVKLKGVDYGEYDALKEMPLSDILVMVESDRAELQQWYFMEPRNSTPDSHGSTV